VLGRRRVPLPLLMRKLRALGSDICSWKVGRDQRILLPEGLVDEIFLTLCPVIIGGDRSPTPVDGRGLSRRTSSASGSLPSGGKAAISSCIIVAGAPDPPDSGLSIGLTARLGRAYNIDTSGRILNGERGPRPMFRLSKKTITV